MSPGAIFKGNLLSACPSRCGQNFLVVCDKYKLSPEITPRYRGQPALYHRIESFPCAQWAAQNWAASKSTNLFLIGCNIILYHVGSMHIF